MVFVYCVLNVKCSFFFNVTCIRFEFVKPREVTRCGWRGYKPSIKLIASLSLPVYSFSCFCLFVCFSCFFVFLELIFQNVFTILLTNSVVCIYLLLYSFCWYLDVCFILRVCVIVFCCYSWKPYRHSCLNLHPCVIHFSQSVSLSLSPSLSLSLSLSILRCKYQ